MSAIGIDIGTTHCCVGVFQNGQVHIIANEQGLYTTPSYVAFTEKEILIGDAAKQQTARNPTNTVFDVKRLIGRKFHDKNVQADIKQWPFKVEAGAGDKPMIVVSEFKGETRKFQKEEFSSMAFVRMKEIAEAYFGKPVKDIFVELQEEANKPNAEEILSMLLVKMKKIAEAYVGKPVKNCFVTVPTYFNYFQCQAMKEACNISGLNVWRLLSETSAAAFAY